MCDLTGPGHVYLQTRSQDAVSDATNTISDACANCHRVYRDVPSAAMRCTPPK